MPESATCPHSAWEFAGEVQPVPGSTPPARQAQPLPVPTYVYVTQRVRCAQCHQAVVFEGLTPHIPNSGQTVGTAESGTVVILRGMVPAPVTGTEPHWQAVRPPAPPQDPTPTPTTDEPQA
jgi:hypothetical protein